MTSQAATWQPLKRARAGAQPGLLRPNQGAQEGLLVPEGGWVSHLEVTSAASLRSRKHRFTTPAGHCGGHQIPPSTSWPLGHPRREPRGSKSHTGMPCPVSAPGGRPLRLPCQSSAGSPVRLARGRAQTPLRAAQQASECDLLQKRLSKQFPLQNPCPSADSEHRTCPEPPSLPRSAAAAPLCGRCPAPALSPARGPSWAPPVPCRPPFPACGPRPAAPPRDLGNPTRSGVTQNASAHASR